ncbi:MAG: UDP-3-O-(3-hydroxymyristoyl)glucosamine N-acyltransferase [Chitinophagales bacterium]
MQLKEPISLKECAAFLGSKLSGDADMQIRGINEIHKVRRGDITFVDFEKYYNKALQSAATFIIINKEVECPQGKGLIFSDDPFRDYVKLVQRFSPFNPSLKNISNTAVIGENTLLFPGVYIGNNCIVGKNCVLHPNVVLYDNTIIGDDVVIHANTVIGADAFYFKDRKTHRDKMISCGRTIIHDHVEIGACVTIDKGVSGDTIIGEHTKMDNHIHIGHGVEIGKMCLFAGGVMIGGKTIIGNNVILWGQVGVSKDLVIEDNVTVLAQSGVGDNLKAGKKYFGSPADEARKKMKELAAAKNMVEIWEKMRNT